MPTAPGAMLSRPEAGCITQPDELGRESMSGPTMLTHASNTGSESIRRSNSGHLA